MTPKTILLKTLRNMNTYRAIWKQDKIHEQLRCRRLKDQVYHYTIICEVSGEECHRRDIELDHGAPFTFEYIVFMFLVAERLKVSNILIDQKGSLKSKDWRIVDNGLAWRFKDFHDQMAWPHLRLVKREVNRELGREHRMDKKLWAQMS